MFIFALPFFSFGIGSLFLLMMSMTADVIDLDELNTGLRREGTFGAIYWLMVKFGFAIAGGLSGVIMSLVGFDSDLSVQPEGAIDGLRMAFSGIPILGTLVAMYVMRNYNLTEERALEISTELAKRKIKKKTKEVSSAYGAGNLVSVLNDNIKLEPYTEIDFTDKTMEDAKVMFADKLNRKLCGLCFSPYVEGQEPNDKLSESQIRRRMDVIAPYTHAIRSFSCTEGNELIPEVAHQKGLNSIAGAWISDDKDRNEKEISALIELAKTGVVNIAAVGNEVLLRGDVSEEELIVYINRVKEALKGLDVLVGYVDTYYEYYTRPNLVEATDIILANCYPFWEGFGIESSLEHLREMYALTKYVAKGKKVIIAETGWPSQGNANEDAHPSLINAMKYFIQTQEWASKEGVEIFHFSSFDESWKVRVEGELGARWGIWDKNEKLKYS
jgi:GPH family glycoside/pentoside/hexuronide:cation symporter